MPPHFRDARREVLIEPTLEGWRTEARRLLASGVPPEAVTWREQVPAPLSQPPDDLFSLRPAAASGETDATPEGTFRVPRAFVDLARDAARHPDPDRWRILYALLWRIAAGEHDLLAAAADPDVSRAVALGRDVREGRVPPPPAIGAGAFVPQTGDLDIFRRAADGCRGCDLYRHATQTVFGIGPPTARAMLVGEQPGDQEDRKGAPFVGPAGEVLDRALVEAGIAREDVYVTNAVKHFKFVPRGKRRIHQTPGPTEIRACRPWLEAELAVVRPHVLVCLGATAAKAVIAPDFRLLRSRGQFLQSSLAPRLLATYHPSAVLRAENDAAGSGVYAALVADLKLAAGALQAASGGPK
jgi:uracil-DNA glycosylase family protein